MTKKSLTTVQAAGRLGVSAARVRQLIAEKRLRAEKFGRSHAIPPDEVKRFVAGGRKKAGRPAKKSLRLR